MRHPDEGTLNALLDAEIPSDELAPITAHLAECAECRARLEEARALMGETDTLILSLGDGAPAGGVEMPGATEPHAARTSRFRQLAWAASIMMAAGLGYWVRTPQPTAPSVVALDTDARLAQEPVAEAAPPSQASPAAGEPIGAARESAAKTSATPPGADSRSRERPAAASPPPAAGSGVVALVSPPADTAAAERRAELTVIDSTRLAGRRMLAEQVQSLTARGRQDNRLAQGAPAAPLAMERSTVAVEGFSPVSLAEAIGLLGGSLRLVEGLVPDRLEASATTVRIIYPLREGELVLEQRREGDSLRVSLKGPLSGDSLAALRRRVR